MITNIQKVLIIGATSGLGEGFAECLAKSNKSLILTGRRKERLDSLQKTLSSVTKQPVDTLQWDISDLASIPTTVESVLKAHPDLDTVFINAGIARFFNIADPRASSDASIIQEITTNFTAPALLVRAFLPHLVSVAASGRHAALILTSSGLAFSPTLFSPIYCATKAAAHSLMMSTRHTVAAHKDPNVYKYLSVCEVIPPFVATELNDGQDFKAPSPPMPRDEYLKDAHGKLERGLDGDGKGKLPWEVGTGSAEMRANAWRGAIAPIES